MFPTNQMVSIKRKAIESLYQDTATITTAVKGQVDSKTGRVINGVKTSPEYPCRISYKTFPIADNPNGIAEFSQLITLFIAPEVNIPAGSKVTVNHLGKTLEFTSSGIPALYTDHQEIELKNRVKHNG